MPNDNKPETTDGLSWTGERFLPNLEGPMRLEHVHRYLLARALAAGKDVLDIACGEGYGADLLATAARSVIGVDNAADAVRHAEGTYRGGNLRFLEGTCSAIPLADASVDLAVSFETLEHHGEHEAMLRELVRVLRPGGVLLLSTPDRREYSERTGTQNPFHVKELDRPQLESLIRAHFKQAAFYGQRVLGGSCVAPLEPGLPAYFLDLEGPARNVRQSSGVGRPLFLIALASAGALPSLPCGFYEGDPASEGALTERLARERDGQTVWALTLDKRLGAADAAIRGLQEQLKAQTAWAVSLKADVEARDALITGLQAQLKEQTDWALRLKADVETRDGLIRALQEKPAA